MEFMDFDDIYEATAKILLAVYQLISKMILN